MALQKIITVDAPYWD